MVQSTTDNSNNSVIPTNTNVINATQQMVKPTGGKAALVQIRNGNKRRPDGS